MRNGLRSSHRAGVTLSVSRFAVALLAAALALTLLFAGAAEAGSRPATVPARHKHHGHKRHKCHRHKRKRHKCHRHKHHGHKHKPKIHKAWPQKRNGRKPHRRLARRLARQVGPVKRGKKRHNSSAASAPPLVNARAAQSPGLATVAGPGSGDLLLVRSFDIPTDDPQYADLVNFSWTYDNALATIAFVADKDRSQARQLLDQLAALQNRNGSFDFAFDVKSGAGAQVVRSNAVAWVGLAAAAFADKYGDKSYDEMAANAVAYLLNLRNGAGLIRGGPDVSWVSTQHNLLAYELLREMAALAKHSHSFAPYSRSDLIDAADALGTAIDAKLVSSSGGIHFREGAGDDRIPIDVQALGSMYLQVRSDPRADQVGSYIEQDGFWIPSRSTTAAPGKVSGLRPFLDPGSPNLIWSEGTIESQFALTRLGDSRTRIADAVDSLAATISGGNVGPIGADRNSTTIWGEYRTWPASATASWLLMLRLQKSVALFSD